MAAVSPVEARDPLPNSDTYPCRARSNECPASQATAESAIASAPRQIGQARRSTTSSRAPTATVAPPPLRAEHYGWYPWIGSADHVEGGLRELFRPVLCRAGVLRLLGLR